MRIGDDWDSKKDLLEQEKMLKESGDEPPLIRSKSQPRLYPLGYVLCSMIMMLLLLNKWADIA